MIADEILSCLDKVKQTGEGRWVALCPCHEEKTPSMCITEKDDAVYVHCFGCGANGKDVCEKLGIEPFKLFADGFKAGDYKKPKIPATDILRCISFESLFISMCADQLSVGTPLKDDDRERLKLAAKRVRQAAIEGGLN